MSRMVRIGVYTLLTSWFVYAQSSGQTLFSSAGKAAHRSSFGRTFHK